MQREREHFCDIVIATLTNLTLREMKEKHTAGTVNQPLSRSSVIMAIRKLVTAR